MLYFEFGDTTDDTEDCPYPEGCPYTCYKQEWEEFPPTRYRCDYDRCEYYYSGRCNYTPDCNSCIRYHQ